MQFGTSVLLAALTAFATFAAKISLFDRPPAPATENVQIIDGFEGPYGLAVFGDGTLYVMDGARSMVMRYTPALEFTGWLGVTGSEQAWRKDGAPASNALLFPHAIVEDGKGELLVSNHRNGTVSRYAKDGKFLGLFNPAPELPELAFKGPVHVFVDAKNNVWVSDYEGHRIMKFAPDGSFIGWKGARTDGSIVQTWATNGTSKESSAPGSFHHPHMTAVDADGNLYVADTRNNRIQKFAADGSLVGWIGAQADGNPTNGWTKQGASMKSSVLGGFINPTAVTLAEDGMLIVTDTDNNRIVRFDAATGRFAGWLGGMAESVTDGWSMEGTSALGSAPGAFNSPFHAQLFDGKLYVADTGNKRVQIIPLDEW